MDFECRFRGILGFACLSFLLALVIFWNVSVQYKGTVISFDDACAIVRLDNSEFVTVPLNTECGFKLGEEVIVTIKGVSVKGMEHKEDYSGFYI